MRALIVSLICGFSATALVFGALTAMDAWKRRGPDLSPRQRAVLGFIGMGFALSFFLWSIIGFDEAVKASGP